MIKKKKKAHTNWSFEEQFEGGYFHELIKNPMGRVLLKKWGRDSQGLHPELV